MLLPEYFKSKMKEAKQVKDYPVLYKINALGCQTLDQKDHVYALPY